MGEFAEWVIPPFRARRKRVVQVKTSVVIIDGIAWTQTPCGRRYRDRGWAERHARKCADCEAMHLG